MLDVQLLFSTHLNQPETQLQFIELAPTLASKNGKL